MQTVYADNADNFVSFNDRSHPDGVALVLATAERQPPTTLQVVVAPSPRGLILERRVTPPNGPSTPSSRLGAATSAADGRGRRHRDRV